MIDRFAELLGMDEQALISAIRYVAGTDPQMTMGKEVIDVTDETRGMVTHEVTGFGVIIASGMADDFEIRQEREGERVVAATLSFRGGVSDQKPGYRHAAAQTIRRMGEALDKAQAQNRRYREALEEIITREARSQYESIYSCPGEFASIARKALS